VSTVWICHDTAAAGNAVASNDNTTDATRHVVILPILASLENRVCGFVAAFPRTTVGRDQPQTQATRRETQQFPCQWNPGGVLNLLNGRMTVACKHLRADVESFQNGAGGHAGMSMLKFLNTNRRFGSPRWP
jgi:hypothetical protein